MCSARQTLEFFFHWFFLTSFLLHNCSQLFSLGSVEAAPNRETWTNFHHKNTCLFFLCFTSEPPEKSIFCCSGNYAKLPVRQNTVLPCKKAASCVQYTAVSPSGWRSCRRTQLYTLSRGTSEICFLPGHDFCWNCGGQNTIRFWTKVQPGSTGGAQTHTHTICGGWSERNDDRTPKNPRI